MRKKLIYIAFGFLICFLILLNYIQIFFMKSKIEKLENRVYDRERIVFLGDSITNRYDLDKHFINHYVINSGVGGNLTQDILNDIDNRVNKYNPSKLFLLIGTNDLVYSDLSLDGIKDNIEKIIDEIRLDNPNTKIYLESLYPVNSNVNEEMVAGRKNDDIIKLNEKIKTICEEGKCTYIDMYNKLLDRNGNLKRIYTADGIHLNRIGYVKVTMELKKYLDEEIVE